MRKVKTVNSMKPWSVDDLWLVYKEGQSRRLAQELGRTAYALRQVNNLTARALRERSVDEAQILLHKNQCGKTTTRNILEIWRRVHLNKYSPSQPSHDTAPEVQSSRTLSQEIDKIDELVEELKNQIVLVATLAAEQKAVDKVSEKEKEIEALKVENASLQTVVDAAESNNLADSLKSHLMGR